MATFNTINTNRIINITCSNSSGDWRGNLNRILGGNSANSDFIGKSFGDLTVKDDVHLLMESSPSVTTEFNTATPVSALFSHIDSKNKGSELLRKGTNLLSTIRNNATGSDSNATVWHPWVKNVVSSDNNSIDSLGFTYTFNFAIGQYGLWNAKEEVVKPILNLMAPTIPRYLHNLTLEPAFPAAFDLLAKMGISGFDALTSWYDSLGSDTGNSGDNAGNVETDTSSDGNSVLGNLANFAERSTDAVMGLVNGLSESILDTYKDFTYTVKFGNIYTFNNMIIRKASPSFSIEVDQFGYPISGSIELTFKGVTPVALRSESGLNALTLFGNN